MNDKKKHDSNDNPLDEFKARVIKISTTQNQPDESNGLWAHYGVKLQDAKEQSADILRDFLLSNDFSVVLDKHFPTLTAEQRMKVQSYAIALRMMRMIEGE